MYHNRPILDNLGFMRVKYLFLTIALLAFKAVAVEVVLEPIKVFPVAKQLQYENGAPSTIIDTGTLRSDVGSLARGPHTVRFNLAADAIYPVVVDGQTVNPGDSIEFKINLTLTDHKITFPVYPAVAGIEGTVNYTIDIPVLKDSPCESYQTEKADMCVTKLIEVLIIDCPTEYVVNAVGGITCENYTAQDMSLDCDTDYKREGPDCLSILEEPVVYDCVAFPGSTLQSTMCMANDVYNVYVCEAGYSQYSSQCRTATTSYAATLTCTWGTWNGSKCEYTAGVASQLQCPSWPYHMTNASDNNRTAKINANTSTSDIQAIASNHACHLATAPTPTPEISTYRFDDDNGKWAAPSSIMKFKSSGVPCDSGWIPNDEGNRCFVNQTEKERSRLGYIPRSSSNTVCPLGYTWTAKFEGKSIPQVLECFKDASIPLTLERGACWNSSYSYSSSTGRCEKQVFVDRNVSCPSGGDLNGTSCQTYDYRPLGKYCTDGGTYDAGQNKCLLEVNENATKSCPADHVMLPGDTSCLNQESYTFSYCEESFSVSSDASKCERLLTEVPVLSCDNDTFDVDEENVECTRVDEFDFLY
jgi:hypothetical protein